MEFSPGSGAITNFPKIGASETRRAAGTIFVFVFFVQFAGCVQPGVPAGIGEFMRRMILLTALAAGIAFTAQAQSEITLLAPVPMRTPLDKIVANFQAKMNHKVKVTYGTGLSTRQSIAKGEPLDVTLAVAPFFGAIASGNVIPSSATPIVSFLMAVARREKHPKAHTAH